MEQPSPTSDAPRRSLRQRLGSGYLPSVATARKTPQHTVAVDDELWQTAMRIAERRRETLSDVIRRGLLRYVARHRSVLDDE